MLNPALHAVLRKHFGDVRVYNEDVERVERRVGGKMVVETAGESYNVDCPVCGDTRQRLSISYKWLSQDLFTRKLQTRLINCYNEGCALVHRPEFYERYLDDLRAASLGLLEVPDTAPRRSGGNTGGNAIRLPDGCIPFNRLPDTHPAVDWVFNKYRGFPRSSEMIEYLAGLYGLMFCPPDVEQTVYRNASNRLIFPITAGGRTVAWQGRTIDPDENKRWYLPPGFTKSWLYNADSVGPYDVPVICEGITSAIGCGTTGIAIYGKTINSIIAQLIADRWKEVIVATDPTTFIEDNTPGGGGRVFAQEIIDLLSPLIRVRSIRWPDDVMAIAERWNNNDRSVQVPDAADLGIPCMQKLIEGAV